MVTKESCKTSLYVWARSLAPEVVTKAFEVEPSRTIAEGKLTIKKGPRKVVSAIKQNTDMTMWVREIEKRRRTQTVEQQLAYWCEFLEARKAALRTLRKAGGEIRIDAFMMESMPLFIDLPTVLTAGLGKLKIPVKMTIYDINDPQLLETN